MERERNESIMHKPKQQSLRGKKVMTKNSQLFEIIQCLWKHYETPRTVILLSAHVRNLEAKIISCIWNRHLQSAQTINSILGSFGCL